MNDRVLRRAELGARISLGLVFGYAGLLKLRDPQAFADSIHSFTLVPSMWINPVALGLPVLELATGLLLLLGVRRRACAALVMAMSIGFTLALVQAMIRGIPVDCGCFGSGAPSFLKALLAVVRDLGLVALAFIVVCRAGSPRRAT